MPIPVHLALENAIQKNNPWLALIVLRAHPLEAFKLHHEKIPVVWLAKDIPMKHLAKELFYSMPSDRQTTALYEFSKAMTLLTLESIAVCMTFQTVFPEQSLQRKLRRESKLAKSISNILIAAKASSHPAPLQDMLDAIEDGVMTSFHEYWAQHKASSFWLQTLQWDVIGQAALSRSENKELKKTLKSDGLISTSGIHRL